MRCFSTWFALGLTALLVSNLCAQPQVLTLNNGLEYEGEYITIPEYNTVIGKGVPVDGGVYAITLVNDGLRRIYFNHRHVARPPIPLQAAPFQRIKVWQELSAGQSKEWRFGQLTRSTPFDEYGRRQIFSNGRGPIELGMTLVTPKYCTLTALKDTDWKMEIATSSVPSDVLIPMLRRQISDPNSINQRLEIVDLLFQSRRFQDASAELKSIQLSFPDLTSQIKENRDRLSQEFANQVLEEIRLRMQSGQVELSLSMAERLKVPDVSGTILAEILDLENSVRQQATNVELTQNQLINQLELLIKEGALDGQSTTVVSDMVNEIARELRPSNLERLATFSRLVSDTAQTTSQKLAYAISGWLIGSASATDNMAVALSLPPSRALVQEYLSTAGPARREEILSLLSQMESGETSVLSKIIANMLPPLAPTEDDLQQPLEFEFSMPTAVADGTARTVKYHVQLPPQYDPYRRYPCLVVLHPEGRDARQELQWWTGAYNPGLKMSVGHAARFGYIVVAPQWNLPEINSYLFTDAEQLAVLKATREAMRRFSIDTDRIYLAGHFAGGDAAWDVGLSHPEVWAGVIPVSAYSGTRGGYAYRCFETAKDMNIAFYFVFGQHDLGRIEENKVPWNRWLISPAYDVTLIEFKGRLAEMFDEEVPEMMRWMSRHVRNPAVEAFTGRSLRPWNRGFWWIEVDHIPDDDVVLPHEWPPKEQIRTEHFDCSFNRERNQFLIRAAAGDNATLWITPELVDLSRTVEIIGRGLDFRGEVRPNRRVLLEDVRTRGDRQHPYWAKIVCQKSSWRVE